MRRSGRKLYLPQLPQSLNTGNVNEVFGRAHHTRTNARRQYRIRGRAIIAESLRTTRKLGVLYGYLFPEQPIPRPKYRENFTVVLMARYILEKCLTVRDEWVKHIYYGLHQLKSLCSRFMSQIGLIHPTQKRHAILGNDFHLKGYSPYFPEFTFKNGKTHYAFESAKTIRDKIKATANKSEIRINECNEFCIKATADEADQIEALYASCMKLDKSTIRDFLTELNECPEKIVGPYELNCGRRNHSKQCFTASNRCVSAIPLLTKLYPHYGNLRKFHKALSHLQFMNSMLHDLDAALKHRDVGYLLHLFAYKPPQRSQTVYNIKPTSSTQVINEKTLLEEYGKSYEKFVRECSNLPQHPCISCDRLITSEKIKCIKSNWKHFDNGAYTQLFNYLNSDARLKRGGDKVATLAGRNICDSCCQDLNRNQMPFRSVVNDLDIGVVPEVISTLSPFESIFIRLAICYQTIVKLAPSGAGIPYNQRMQSLKGFAVHLPAPVSETIQQLNQERPTSLINPDDFIILYGLPKKDKTVWRHLVNVNKIHNALKWLKENNPLYANVIIPDEPENLLPGNDSVARAVETPNSIETALSNSAKDYAIKAPHCPGEDTELPNILPDAEDMLPALEEEISDRSIESRVSVPTNTFSASEESTRDAEKDRLKKHIEAMTEKDVQNYIEHYSVTGLDNLEANGDLDNLYQLLKLDEKPISTENKRKDALCFPEIFPYSVGGKDTSGKAKKIQEYYYEELRLKSKHGHVRRNIPYLFSLGQDHEKRSIKQGVFASVKNVKGILKDSGKNDFTKMLKDNDPRVQRRLSRSAGKIPNTSQYWLTQKGKLDSLIQTFGPPTWFLTFNPAEYNWDDLILYIRSCNADLEGIDNMTDSEVLARDPVLVSNAIRQRFRALLSFILETDVLGGEVTHYYVRKEYQNRGTCHYHCIFWIKDAPVIGRDADEEVIKFILKCVTCRLPDKVLEARLNELVTSLQLHKCQAYCLTKIVFVNGVRVKVCRFGYPRPVTDKFLLSSVLSCIVGRLKSKFKKRLFDLVRTEEEKYINDYCPKLLFLWKGNMDIQFLSENSYAVAEYVTKYITKKETLGLETYIDNESRSAFQKTMRFVYACLRNREMSAHEVVDRMLQDGGEMWICSEKFEFVSTCPPAKRTRVLRPLHVIEKQKMTTEQALYPDLIHNFYPCRPQNDNFDEMSLYDFVLKYRKIDIVRANKKVNAVQIVEGSKVIACYEPRPTDAIPVIQHHNFDIVKDPELYFYSMLILYKPWRFEADIRGDSDTYEAEFFRMLDALPLMKQKYETKRNIRAARDRVEKSVQELMTSQNGKSKNTDDNSDDSGSDDIDEDHAIAQCLQDFEDINKKSKIKTEAELLERVGMLNADQRSVYNTITGHLSHVLDHSFGENKCPIPNCAEVEPLLLFVSGPGGTGKTFLLEAIVGYMYVETYVRNRDCKSILCAPSGLAANNIGGSTIHSIFKIPVERGSNLKYAPLPKRTRDEMKAVMGHIRCVIIDEISMVSNILLLLIHLRLGELYTPTASFGGVKTVIVFGDLLQLPPVNEEPTFVTIPGKRVAGFTGGTKINVNLWEDFTFAELTVNQRQSGDKNSVWRDILQRVRLGVPSNRDNSLLFERCIPISDDKLMTPDHKLDEVIKYFEHLISLGHHPTCLLPTCEMVERFNVTVMRKNFPDYHEITANDSLDYVLARNKSLAEEAVAKLNRLEDPRQTGGLEKCIHLCEGVRVMLRTNLNVKEGLVNGSMGTVISLVHCPTTNQVKTVNIKFDGKEETSPINRARRKVNLFPGAWLHREMFPICLAYAMTIHRSQGLTLKCVLADLGQNIFGPSQCYVAMSRVTALEGLHLINYSPQKVIANAKGSSEYLRLGSKPYGDSTGVELETVTSLAKDQSKVLPAKIPERIWYRTKNRKKAETMVSDLARQSCPKRKTSEGNSLQVKGKKTNKKTGSKPMENFNERRIKIVAGEPSTSKRNAIPSKSRILDRYVDINSLSSKKDSIAEIKRLVRKYPNCRANFLSLVDTREKFDILFDDVILRYAEKNVQDNILGYLANQLHPDPFGYANSNPTQKWLTSDLMDLYGLYLKETYGGSIYYAGSMARHLFLSDRNNYIPGHIHGTHAMEHYSIRPKAQYEHSISAGLKYAGDPILKDRIIMFCNDVSTHWYLLILNISERKALHYDSGAYIDNDISERCKFIINFVNDLRDEVFRNSEYSTFGWDRNLPALNPHEFDFEDAKSVRQQNGFDCGVYTMINAESYLKSADHSIFKKDSIPFMRMVCMSLIYDFIQHSNYPEL